MAGTQSKTTRYTTEKNMTHEEEKKSLSADLEMTEMMEWTEKMLKLYYERAPYTQEERGKHDHGKERNRRWKRPKLNFWKWKLNTYQMQLTAD